MPIPKASIIHHVGLVLVFLWVLSAFNCCHPITYFVSFVYLYQVHEKYILRLQKKLQFQERRLANQKRILSDSETARWLNNAIEKMWPICLEQVLSNKILLPIIPWFLEKYKPWTAKDAMIQHLYLGRNPPMFTDIRIFHQSSDDDHLVLEMGMNFLTADDMSGVLSVKLRKRLGFGMWTKLHLTGMHVEGKILVGIKFLRKWPFIGRLRVCFVEPPYFQLTVKPLSTHAFDVTEIPGIAGWLDKLLGVAFERTLVEPNMLVVDVEKFASPDSDCWFSMDEKEPVAYARVEVIEALDIKPSDLNGLADPYVKGQLGPYRFQTKTRWKTLCPKWQEEFKIPICSWEIPNVLVIKVRDKDRFIDDTLGECSVSITDLKDGQRHDMWLCLENIRMGRLHLAITVLEENGKEQRSSSPREEVNQKSINTTSLKVDTSSDRVADVLEPVDVAGQDKMGVFVHHPGSDVSQTWKPRKGARVLDTQISGEANSLTREPASVTHGPNEGISSDENLEYKRPHSPSSFRRGLHKMGSMLHSNFKNENRSQNLHDVVLSPNANIKEANRKDIKVKIVVEDGRLNAEGNSSTGGSGSDSPRVKMKERAKNVLHHARNIKRVFSTKRSKSRSEQAELGEMPIESSSSSDEPRASSDTGHRSHDKPDDTASGDGNHLLDAAGAAH